MTAWGSLNQRLRKKGESGIALVIEPGKGLVDDDLAGVAFHGPDGFAVAQKVGWIFVVGMCAVDEAEPVVEAVFGGGGVLAIVGGHAEMPFAEVSRGRSPRPGGLRRGWSRSRSRCIR